MSQSKYNQRTEANIATIVGTWARNISPDIDSRDPGKPFPTFALEIGKRWQQDPARVESQVRLDTAAENA
jgi:hypothetical protein